MMEAQQNDTRRERDEAINALAEIEHEYKLMRDQLVEIMNLDPSEWDNDKGPLIHAQWEAYLTLKKLKGFDVDSLVEPRP